jgi:hypothetical protein
VIRWRQALRGRLRVPGGLSKERVAIEFRWANLQIDKLPEMADELAGFTLR